MIPRPLSRLINGWSNRAHGESPRARFAHIMDVARRMADQRPESLFALIHALARPVISAQLVAPAVYDERIAPGHFPDDNALFKRLWFDPQIPLTGDRRNSFDLRVYLPSRSRISFCSDPVFTLPWHTERFEAAVIGLGAGSDSEWRADQNHLVHLWLPFRIGLVAGGNHSIAAAILSGRGEVASSDTIDFRALFEHVSCDGHRFIRVHDGRVLAPVAFPEWAAIFEIGRMLAAP